MCIRDRRTAPGRDRRGGSSGRNEDVVLTVGEEPVPRLLEPEALLVGAEPGAVCLRAVAEDGGPWARVVLVQVTGGGEFGRAGSIVGGGRRGGVEELLEETEGFGEADRPPSAVDTGAGGGECPFEGGDSIGDVAVDGAARVVGPHRHAELADRALRRGQRDAPGVVLVG